MVNISFSVGTVAFMLMLLIICIVKKVNIREENKIYIYIVVTSFIGVCLDCISFFLVDLGVLKFYTLYRFLTKLILCYYDTYCILFMLYIITVCYRKKNVIEKAKKYKITLLYILLPLMYIFTFILPIDYVMNENMIYPTGISVIKTYLFAFFGIILIILFLMKNKQYIKSKEFLPLLILIVFTTIAIIIQSIVPGLILLTWIEAIVTFIMYFTIENPDVKMIAQLNEAKAQAEKANNAKSEFLSSMSHEIRTPLNAIVGFSQALSEEDLSDEAREEVRDIISASNTLLEIVNGILDISKIEANKLEIINKEYNFKDIFDELVALTKGRLGEKPLEFKYIYDESIPSVLYGDHVRVKQIILNLLTNSVKYTKEGSITFTVNSVKKDDVIRLIVSVEDTGIGIKEENIGKLFSKFERFDEKNTTIEGTGLGLAITKQLVELMNGKIVVQSVYGKGSKFTVALDQKIVHGKVIESKDNNEDVVEFDLTGKKVLIVDDNNLNLKVASRLIKNYKCDITTVTSGIECLDKINNKEVFDLILMDDMMPRMSGGETLIRLKKIEGFNIPVVALTANAVTGMKEKYLQQGFDDYLAKPIEKGELNRVLHKFLKED